MEGHTMLKVEYLKTAKLIPYANNSRTHSDEQTAQIASSIKEFGFTNPILIDEQNGVIAGHGRIKAAQLLSMDELPCIRLLGLSKAQKKAYVIADNKLALNAGWDTSLLSIELQDLKSLEFDLALTGFGIGELEALLNPEVAPSEGLTDPDAIPESTETRCKPGDLWILGDHRLLCGDSTNVQHVERLMGGEKADMVFTDPPYGMNLDTDFAAMENYTKSHNGKTAQGKDSLKRNKNVYSPVINDDRAFDASYLVLLADEVFLWGADYYRNTIPLGGSWFVWDKKTTEGLQKMFGADFELCWSKKPHERKIIRHTWAGCFGFDKKNDGQKRVHPTQKPVVMCADFISSYSESNGLVLDLFLGSGSTLIACEKTKRKCFGMEIDAKYCDVILTRWEQFTGKTATLEVAND